MITYECDRCGSKPTPEKFYEVELIFTPHDPDSGLDVDKEDRKVLGHLCAECTDTIEPLVQELVRPPRVTTAAVLVSEGDTQEHAE